MAISSQSSYATSHPRPLKATGTVCRASAATIDALSQRNVLVEILFIAQTLGQAGGAPAHRHPAVATDQSDNQPE